MRQFFINHLINNEFVIDHNGDCHHAKVVRLKVGEQIVVVYRQQRYQAVIEGINLDQQKNITKIWGKVVQPLNNYEHDYQLTVFFALNQQKSWEFLVPKLTELGVSCLTPIICAFDQPSHWLTNQQ